MTDYVISGWSIANGPVPEPTYGDGEVFHTTITFTEGPLAYAIRRLGAYVAVDPIDLPLGASVTVSNNNIIAASAGSTADLTIRSAPAPGQTIFADCWFNGYTSPTQPSGSGVQVVRFFVAINTSVSGTYLLKWLFKYTPDPAAFNPQLLVNPMQGTFQNRARSLADFEYRWCSDSGYVTLVSSASAFTVSPGTYPGDTITYYLQYRPTGSTGAYTNYGAVIWNDPRPIV